MPDTSILQNVTKTQTGLDLALDLASLGWHVFPCNPDKTPRTRSGFKAATCDPAGVRAFGAKWQGALIGVACQASGFFALDIDNKNDIDGGASWADLVVNHGGGAGVFVGPMQYTPSGGAHLLFALPDFDIPNNAGQLGPGLDLRSKGYICTGSGYTWPSDHRPELAITAAPAWLLDLIRAMSDKKAPRMPQAEKSPPAAGDSANYWLRRALVRASVGTRNQAGFWLAQQLRDDGLGMAEAEGVLQAYANQVPQVPGSDYTEAEALASLKSAYAQPRREPARKLGGNGHQAAELPGDPPPPENFAFGDPSHFGGNGHKPQPEGELLPTTPTPGNYGLDDIGNGQRLAWRHGARLRWVQEWGWLTWNGKTWQPDRGLVAAWCKETARSILTEAAACEDDNKRTAIIKHARGTASKGRRDAMAEAAASEPGIPAAPGDFDGDPWLLNCENGVLDLRNGTLLEHDPARLVTKITAAPYDPEASCPAWLAFLDKIFGGDPDLVAFVQVAVGYSLTGHVSEQCLFFLFGTGANGKSTFTGAIQDLLGGYAMKTRAETLMIRKQDAIPEEVAQLAGVRFMLAAELGEGQRMNESLIKDLTGGDRLRARLLHHNSFEFTPIAKPWLYGNHKPTIRGTDEGIWRRMKLIPFTVTIPEGQRDKRMPEKLRAELPGILAWAVRGAMTWLDRGLEMPKAVKAATEAYRSEQDILATFLDDCTVVNALATVTAGALYDAYKAWAEQGGVRPISKINFSRQLAERGHTTTGRDGAGRAVYSGLGLLAREGEGGQNV